MKMLNLNYIVMII